MTCAPRSPPVPALKQELGDLPNVGWTDLRTDRGTALRFWQEQAILPRLIHRSGADVLISAGNFALWRSPVPQILLSGNSLYTSSDFYRDLRSRKDYRLWLDTRVKGVFAKQSVSWADRTVAPSLAFADELRRWTKGRSSRLITASTMKASARMVLPYPPPRSKSSIPRKTVCACFSSATTTTTGTSKRCFIRFPWSGTNWAAEKWSCS